MERWRKCFPKAIYICHLFRVSLLMGLLFSPFLPPELLRLDLPLGKHMWTGAVARRETSLHITKTSLAEFSNDIVYFPRGWLSLAFRDMHVSGYQITWFSFWNTWAGEYVCFRLILAVSSMEEHLAIQATSNRNMGMYCFNWKPLHNGTIPSLHPEPLVPFPFFSKWEAVSTPSSQNDNMNSQFGQAEFSV